MLWNWKHALSNARGDFITGRLFLECIQDDQSVSVSVLRLAWRRSC